METGGVFSKLPWMFFGQWWITNIKKETLIYFDGRTSYGATDVAPCTQIVLACRLKVEVLFWC